MNTGILTMIEPELRSAATAGDGSLGGSAVAIRSPLDKTARLITSLLLQAISRP